MKSSLTENRRRVIAALLALALGFLPERSGAFELPKHVIAGGGGSSTGGENVRIDATIGQPAAGGPLSSGQYSMQVAFWAAVALRPARLANISTRLRVQTGDNVLIGGFIVTGSESKRLIVRAIGPSLPLATALSDPQLEIYDAGGELVAFNDNWQEAPNVQEIIESTIPPSHPLESAVLGNVNPGAYTAVVRGVNNATGIGLVEAYDLNTGAASKLANISTRGFVQTGDDAMIGGFILVGQNSGKVIVRAIGPSLPVKGKLEDPLLELYDGNGVLMQSNNNWKDTQQSDIEATTIPPSNDLESAILRTLPPAPYTAVVRGVNDTTGVALVEVYALE